MFQELYKENLDQGVELFESKSDLVQARKHLLKARSYASVPTEIFAARYAHARVEFELKEFKQAKSVAKEALEVSSVATQQQKQILDEILSACDEREAKKQAEIEKKKKQLAQAIKDAGGKTPGDKTFLKVMEKRADEGVVDGGWKKVTDLIQAVLKPRQELTLSAVAKDDDPRRSKFGGLPFAVKGDVTPICDRCKKQMDFLLQINHKLPGLEVPKDVGMLVFYECAACSGDSLEPIHGWTVRNYLDPLKGNWEALPLKSVKPVRYLDPSGKPQTAVPLWEVASKLSPDLTEVMGKLYPPDPGSCFEELAKSIARKGKRKPRGSEDDDFESPDYTIGGYQDFYNGEFVEYSKDGNPMQFLWRVTSTENYCCFGDDGYACLYYSPEADGDNQYRLILEST